MKIKSFSEYFEGYKNYDNGRELDQLMLVDAEKIFKTLKSPKIIESFIHAPVEKQKEMVERVHEGHTNYSFSCICSLAHQYAEYAAIREGNNNIPVHTLGSKKTNTFSQLSRNMGGRDR